VNVSVTGGPPVIVASIAVALEVAGPDDGTDWNVTAAPPRPIGIEADGLLEVAEAERPDGEPDVGPVREPGPDDPDVLVVIGLGPGVPVEIDAAHRDYPDAGVVWLAGDPNGREVADAVAWGCSCVVSQGSELRDVVTGVQHAAVGKAWTTPDLVDAVLDYIRAPTPDPGGGLTARELEVLSMLRAGRSTRQISDDLYISLHTAKNHIRRILAKLQVHSRLEAVAVAERRRLIGLRPTEQWTR
jgi:DNA-binding NarL/FixJ family response regulator